MDPLEKSILDGSFFRGPRTPSPTRTASTSGSSPSSSRSASPDQSTLNATAPRRDGPQTGPKGVRADRDASVAQQKDRKRKEIAKVNQRLQRLAVSAGTWEEQDRLEKRERRLRDQLGELERRQEEEDEDLEGDDDEYALQKFRQQRMAELRGSGNSESLGAQRTAHHYSGVVMADADSYADEVDDVSPHEHVVVLITSKVVSACRKLATVLESLSRTQPGTKFIQVAAVDIGFGIPAGQPTEDEDQEEDSEEEELSGCDARLRRLQQEEAVADVVPTLLVYKAGKLVGNFVRVDLEEDYHRGEEQDVLRILKRVGACCGAEAPMAMTTPWQRDDAVEFDLADFA